MGNTEGKTVEIALSDHSQEDLLSSIFYAVQADFW